MKKIIIVLVLVLLGSFTTQAQRKKKKKKKQIEQVEETVLEVEEMEVEEVVLESTEYSEDDYFTNKNYVRINNKKYTITKLDNNYALYYGNSSKYGLLYKSKVILPNVFSKQGYSDNLYNNKIILGVGYNAYGVFDVSVNKWIVPLENKSIKRLAGDYYAIKKDKYVIVKDLSSGKVIADNKWRDIGKIYGLPNYFMIHTQIGSSYYYKYGIYNIISKKELIPCEYESLNYLPDSNGFMIKKEGLYNIISVENETVFANWYEALKKIEGLYLVKKDGRMGVIDNAEKVIVPITYLKIIDSKFPDGSYLAQNSEGKYGCITIEGKTTVPFKYSKIKRLNYSNNLKIEDNDKCGILTMNNDGPQMIATCNYDDVIRGNNNYFIALKNGYYGLLDSNGKVILDFKYIKISPRHNSKEFIVTSDKGMFLYSEKGFSKKYKSIKSLRVQSGYSSSTISDKYIIVQNKKGKFSLIDQLGTAVTSYDFDDILYGVSKTLIVVKKNNKIGVYDILKQQYVVPLEYNQIVLDKRDVYLGFKDLKVFKIILGSKVTITPL